MLCQNQQIINNTNSITSCDYNNYIIVKYSKETKYTKFINDNRNSISYIINEDQIINTFDSFTIKSNNPIEIHFSSLITSLENFFNAEKDLNSRNINSVDLSHFDSSLIKSTAHMFSGCLDLKSINFSNFDTSLVTDMSNMFSGCSQLQSIILSYIDLICKTYLNFFTKNRKLDYFILIFVQLNLQVRLLF